MDVGGAIIKSHATTQMIWRGISEATVRAVLRQPEQVLVVRKGRVVAQAIVDGFLVRAFVDVDRHPPEVVAVYRASRISKYRSRP